MDGNANKNMADESCVHPDTNHDTAAPDDRGKPAWWRVDLGANYDVYEVRIHNRDMAQCNCFDSLLCFMVYSHQANAKATLLTYG